MKIQIEYETERKVKRLKGSVYPVCDVFLKVDNEYFDPDSDSDLNKKTQNMVHDNYLKTIKKFNLGGCTMLVVLSGLHNDIVEIQNFVSKLKPPRNVVFHYHNWEEKLDGAVDEISSALIECDMDTLTKLFDSYWFSLG